MHAEHVRMLSSLRAICAVLVMTIAGCPQVALAWGATGHHIINNLAISSLPAGTPAFLRASSAIAEVTDLGLYLDLLKGAGNAWDSENDPGHYLDLLDNGTIEGGLPLSDLPPTREAYDATLRARGTDPYTVGYLPYSILEGWQQLRMDFAYWRVDAYESRRARTARLRQIAAMRQNVDEQVIRRDVGVWGHYLADASQPLHVTVHFNGWGKYPNPRRYSESNHMHDLFETVFVDRYVTREGVAKYMTPDAAPVSHSLASGTTVLHAIERYLAASNATVMPLFDIDKDGGFTKGTAQAKAFVDRRLAFGASEMRTLIVWAWNDSLNQTIGDDKPQKVADIVSARVVYAGLK